MCYLCFVLLQFLQNYGRFQVGKLLDNQKAIEFNAYVPKILFLVLFKVSP